MSVKHTYMTKDGLETKVITKAKAIRAKCLDCSGWQPSEVTRCTCHTCALYPFRFGNEKGLERWYEEKKTPKKTIKKIKISKEEEDEWAEIADEE